MLIATGKKKSLSVRRGSEIEVSSEEIMCGERDIWYCAILEENLPKSRKTSFSVRHLHPIHKQDRSPPLIKTTVQRCIRPVPPLFANLVFEEGDVIDAIHDGFWWAGWVIKVLGNGRYLVYIEYDPGAIEIDRKHLRPRLVWKNNEWFRCEKKPLVEADVSEGKSVEFRSKVDNMGDVWKRATAVKENADGTFLVKYGYSNTEISLPYSKIRPLPPSCWRRHFKLNEKVDVNLDSRYWCPGVVSKVPHKNPYEYHYPYVVVLGRNKERKTFSYHELRPTLEWKDGVWFREGKGSYSEQSLTPSTSRSVAVPNVLGDQKNALAIGKEARERHSSGGGAVVNPSPTSSNGVDVSETSKVSDTESRTPVPATAAHLTNECSKDPPLWKSTGKKESLNVSKGSEIEVPLTKYSDHMDNTWYCAILEENLPENKKKSPLVRYLDPLLKQDYSPPLMNTAVQHWIRPVPPMDLFPDVEFEEGDVIDGVKDGAWRSGLVLSVLENQRYLVCLNFDTGAIEFERKHMRPHMIWSNEEWFLCKKQKLKEPDYSAGKIVEFRTEVEHLGEVWASAKVLKEKEDGTLLVKLKNLWNPILCNNKYKFTKISLDNKHKFTKLCLPYSKIRPSRPIRLYESYKLMDKVDVLLESKWCPGVVSEVLSMFQYVVVFGPNKESKEFGYGQLRHTLEWKDGFWIREEKGSDSEESPPEGKRTPNALATGKEVKETHSSGAGAMDNPPPTSSYGVDVAETGKVSINESETPVPDTTPHLTEELRNKVNAVNVINENTPATREPETGTTKEFHSSIVLGIAATTLKKPVVKTGGNTSPRKILQAMKNQKGCTNDSDGEKAPEETKNREINKRKRGQPCKFISTEPQQKMQKTGLEIIERTPTPEKQPERDVHKEDAFTRMESQFETLKKTFVELTGMVAALQEKDGHGVDKGDAVNNITVKTGVAANSSKAATIELTNMNDGNRPLASSAQSVSRSPDPMLNSVVEKHVDVEKTPPTRESTMVLPFAKKSPLWKVLESMEVFKLVPQHPHFSPLLENEVESREGDAIGRMVMYTGLLEELKNLQVDHAISSIKRIDECLLKLEKHGFNVTEPRYRIAKLLVIKERQTRTLEEFKAIEEQITTSNNKRRKTEEDIFELQNEFQRREAVLKEAKVKLDTEIARMQSEAAVIDHKVHTVDQDFQAIVNAPW